jgi:hypothetical protein
MSTNESTIDRIIRGVLGVAALIGAVVLGIGSVAGAILAAVGGILVITGAVGFCPLYRVLGISTCPVPRR